MIDGNVFNLHLHPYVPDIPIHTYICVECVRTYMSSLYRLSEYMSGVYKFNMYMSSVYKFNMYLQFEYA